MTDDPRPGEVTTGDVPDALPALPHFWRELFDRAPAAISVVSPEGRQVAGNAAYAALFGYTQAEVEQLHVSQLTRPEDQRWTEGYLRRLRDGEIDGYQTEKVYVRSDGSTFRAALDVRAVRRDGRLRALIGVIVPIHRREPLGGGRLRKLVEHIHDTITLLDADGTLIETTGRYTPILGYPAEFWERRTAFDVIVDEDVPRLLELRAQILDKPGEVVHATMRVRDSDNAVQLLDAHAVNLLDDPEVGGIVVTTRNVTTEHQLLQQLRDSRDEAVAEAELRSRMIATVSHELRNPLHAVQGISELLNAGPLTEESRQLARTLDRQLRALTRVVDDLLTSSRIELGSMRVELDDVDLRAIVDDVVSVASLDAASGVVVRSTVDDDLPPLVRTDPVRFRQVLTNLVGNAVKFTARGSVDVTVRVEPGRQLVLEVTDTGPGIAADEQTMIFEPFRSSANAGRAAGAGLGLSIVERIVTMLGGSVSVSSALGAGSTFTVELPPAPFSEAPDDDPGRGRIARPVMLSGIDVVVIEDDPVNQQVAEAQLRSLGASYHIVGTGEEGVELVAQRAAEGLPVDVVLMDHHLPGIKGTEAARRIRSDEQATGRRVPIIGVSADASAADRGRSLAAGMDDHLVKPVSLVQLSTAIRRAVDRDASRMSQRHAQVVEVNGPGPVLDRLADELGDRSVVVEVVEVYLGELDRRVDGIVGAVRIGDGEAVRRLVHTLTAGSELLGVGALPTSCSAFARGELDEAGLRATAAAARDALVRWASSSTG